MQYVLYNELSNNGRGGETLEVVKGKFNRFGEVGI